MYIYSGVTDVAAYGLGGNRNESSQLYNRTSRKNITLSAPVLNISAYDYEDKLLSGQNTPELLNKTWARGNRTFEYEYIKNNGKCQNTGVSCSQF